MHNKAPSEIVSHWNKLFDGITFSPDEFYDRISTKLGARQIPRLELGRVSFKERGTFSANRIYLRVMQGSLIFDICAAPYGNNAFFVSAWTGVKQELGCLGCLFAVLYFLPLVGMFVEKNAAPLTYYEVDSVHMFQEVVHMTMLETIDEITTEKGITPLLPDERKAQLKKLANI